ncbi:MAG: hypothetical protein JRI46_02390 [Deltaproteobacteria bacterium]|nr:hypothetical protein [Deltaproteobacteria bacterium]
MADEKFLGAVCKRCGKPLSEDEQDADYCSSCMIELAEQYVPEKAEPPPIKRKRKSRARLVLQWIIFLACISIIAIQSPKLISAFKEGKPLRHGTYSTDAQTDQCIKNLWHISKLLQEGKLPGRDMVCPVSKKPYVVKKIKGDTVVSCPNPELHGVKEIRVSKKYPIPEVIK